MRPQPPVISLLLVALVFPASPQQPKPPVPDKKPMPMIGIITNQALAKESGCRFDKRGETETEKYIFISDSADNALVNIDGRDVPLRFVKRATLRRRFKRREAKGDRYLEVYRGGGGVSVRLIETVTSPCAPPIELCEFVFMKALITVTKGKEREVVRAAGACGFGEP